jgi:hypothetical protein
MMKAYKVTVAARDAEAPHIDTIASYHVRANSPLVALSAGQRAAEKDGVPTTAIRRITVVLTRPVAP